MKMKFKNQAPLSQIFEIISECVKPDTWLANGNDLKIYCTGLLKIFYI